MAGLPGAASAQGTAGDATLLRLEHNADGVYLSANVQIELPAPVEDALIKGVPMFFLAEADIVQARWYWRDKQVASARRHIRLAYQPLTRRWRMNMASDAITTSSMGLALNLNFDSLEEAMSALQRVTLWKIADAGMIEPGLTYKVEFQFSLDLAQLPRPFQIGALGQSDWKLSVTASQQIGPDGAK